MEKENLVAAMEEKFIFVFWLALHLKAQGQQRDGLQLAAELNARGLRTSFGETFKGLRGTYKLLKAAYRYVERRFGANVAAVIADVFTKPDGTHAWA